MKNLKHLCDTNRKAHNCAMYRDKQESNSNLFYICDCTTVYLLTAEYLI